MKYPEQITTRYLGNDERRLFCLQRGDSKYWTGGDGWSRILDKAIIFHTHKAAQAACSALQYAMYKGKPLRSFKVTVAVTLVADGFVFNTNDAAGSNGQDEPTGLAYSMERWTSFTSAAPRTGHQSSA